MEREETEAAGNQAPVDPVHQFLADGEPDPDTGVLPGAYPSDRLVYKVHNVRSWTPYGYGAVEQALYDGELYLRRMGWLKSEYTDGVMPAGWLLSGAARARLGLEYPRADANGSWRWCEPYRPHEFSGLLATDLSSTARPECPVGGDPRMEGPV